MAAFLPCAIVTASLREICNIMAEEKQGTDEPWMVQIPDAVLEWIREMLSKSNSVCSAYFEQSLQPPHDQQVRKDGGGTAIVVMGEIFDI